MARLTRWLVRAAILILVIVLAHKMIDHVVSWLSLTLLPHTEEMMHRAILVATGLYVILMAIPFVPGAEIGLALLTAVGGSLAPMIYLATATSLTMAYLIGRLLPERYLLAGLNTLGLTRAAALVEETAGMSDADLQEKLLAGVTSKWARGVLRHRYIALLLVINLPGNVIIGGGGGIAMVAGLSRLFDPLPFILTVLIAVLPVPLMFFIGMP